jgi:hypothetical protein
VVQVIPKRISQTNVEKVEQSNHMLYPPGD